MKDSDKIEDTSLSARIIRAFKVANAESDKYHGWKKYHTVGDIRNATDDELLRIPGIWKKAKIIV